MQANQPSLTVASGRTEPALSPAVDIVEDAAGISVTADLPGVDAEALIVRVEGRNLVIEAPIHLVESESLSWVYCEVRTQRYRRSFELSGELDTTAIQADLKDGVLTLRLPKVERAKPRRVEVRAST